MTLCIRLLKLLILPSSSTCILTQIPLQLWSHLAPPTIGRQASFVVLPANGQKGPPLWGTASVDPWAWLQSSVLIPHPLIASNPSLLFNPLTMYFLTPFPNVFAHLLTSLPLDHSPSFLCVSPNVHCFLFPFVFKCIRLPSPL